MGCTASKLDNEDTVRRCKERRRLMKDAVFARHHLAAAHADYCRSLRVTGVALSDFAAGEPLLIVSPSTPSVLINNNQFQKNPKSSFVDTNQFETNSKSPFINYNQFEKNPKSPSSISTTSSFKPPPPIKTAPPPFSPTIASSKLPHILSDSSVKSGNKYMGNISNDVVEKIRVKKVGPKLPHILSDSSVSSSTPKSTAFDFLGETTYVGIPNSNYATTPSQASSVWNWDNFYPPPSPPASEFFHQSTKNDFSHHDKNGGFDEDERERGGESEREEVHCSEWGDHYSSTTSESDEDINHTKDDDEEEDLDGDDERDSRSEISELRTRSHFGSSSIRSESGPTLKKVEERSEDGASSSSSRRWKNNGSGAGGREVCGTDEMWIVVRHKDLQEIVSSLKDYFDKAADAGDNVSEMLETGRAQLDRSFRQLKSMFFSILFASLCFFVDLHFGFCRFTFIIMQLL